MSLGKQSARFLVVGALSTAAHVVTAVGLIELAGLSPLAGNTAGFLASLACGFALNAAWTFRAPRAGWRRAFGRYAATCLLGLGYNAAVVLLVTDLLALGYEIALAAIILTWPPMSFALARWWTFARPRARPAPEPAPLPGGPEI